MKSIGMVLLATTLIVLGRFTVPGRALMGWEGIFEFIAHCYVASMVWVGVLWWRELVGKVAWICFFATAGFEIAMFFVQQSKP